jgi:para-nitrobenzyl esterase
VRGTRFLPLDPRQAVTDGRFSRVPVLIGANRDEGRTFLSGAVGMTRSEYAEGVRETFGQAADAVLAHYPWPARPNRFTGAYLAGAYVTDAGLAAGIGGCPNRELTQDLSHHTPTWAYEFNHRTGPGPALEPLGYQWGAGHAAELAYLYPGFNLVPVAPTFDRGERRLAQEMKRFWGSFVHHGNPNVPGQTRWPRTNPTGQVLSLRADGQSMLISDARLAREHKCAFWQEPEKR